MQKLMIIALMGKARAGKDTSGGMLREMGNGVTLAFADKLKHITGDLFGLSHDALYTDEGKVKPTGFDCLMCPECKSMEVEEITLDHNLNARCKVCSVIGALSVFKGKWTPRTILQHLGTEGFRRIDPNVWVRYAMEQAQAELAQLPSGGLHTGMGGKDYVVFTDCRFKSEANAVWNRGGEVWRIKRPETDRKAQGIKGHVSETEQDGISDSECQAIVTNDSTFDELRAHLFVQFQRFLRAR